MCFSAGWREERAGGRRAEAGRGGRRARESREREASAGRGGRKSGRQEGRKEEGGKKKPRGTPPAREKEPISKAGRSRRRRNRRRRTALGEYLPAPEITTPRTGGRTVPFFMSLRLKQLAQSQRKVSEFSAGAAAIQTRQNIF